MKFKLRELTRVNLIELTLLSVAIVYFAAFIARFSEYPIDDSFIHLRIAKNIVEHGQPYFNLGERVMGSAPHLWINLLAGLLWITGGNDSFLPYLALAFTLATFFCCVYLLRSRFSRAWALTIAWLLLALFLTGPAAGLMEAPMATFLYLLTIIFFKQKRWEWTGFFACLSICVRPEAAALAGLAFLLADGKKGKLSFVFGFAPVALVYLIYTLYYFGTVIPFPAIAKHYVFPSDLHWGILNGTSIDIQNEWVHSLEDAILPNHPITWFVWAATCLFLTAAWLLARSLKKLETWPWIFLMCLTSIVIQSVYLFLQKSYIETWYLPLFMLPLALSFAMLTNRRIFLAQIALATFAYRMHLQVGIRDIYALLSGKPQYEQEFFPSLRLQAHSDIGVELQNLKPHATVMVSEIGVFGWAFQGKIIDSLALVSPEALQYHKRAYSFGRSMHVSPREVAELAPDFVVIMDGWSHLLDKAIAAGTLKGYSLWKTYPFIPEEVIRATGKSNLWGSSTVKVFIRDGMNI